MDMFLKVKTNGNNNSNVQYKSYESTTNCKAQWIVVLLWWWFIRLPLHQLDFYIVCGSYENEDKNSANWMKKKLTTTTMEHTVFNKAKRWIFRGIHSLPIITIFVWLTFGSNLMSTILLHTMYILNGPIRGGC